MSGRSLSGRRSLGVSAASGRAGSPRQEPKGASDEKAYLENRRNSKGLGPIVVDVFIQTGEDGQCLFGPLPDDPRDDLSAAEHQNLDVLGRSRSVVSSHVPTKRHCLEVVTWIWPKSVPRWALGHETQFSDEERQTARQRSPAGVPRPRQVGVLAVSPNPS